MEIEKQWFSLAEASAYCGMGEWALRYMMYSGDLPYYKPGSGDFKQRRVILKREDLDRLIENALVMVRKIA